MNTGGVPSGTDLDRGEEFGAWIGGRTGRSAAPANRLPRRPQGDRTQRNGRVDPHAARGAHLHVQLRPRRWRRGDHDPGGRAVTPAVRRPGSSSSPADRRDLPAADLDRMKPRGSQHPVPIRVAKPGNANEGKSIENSGGCPLDNRNAVTRSQRRALSADRGRRPTEGDKEIVNAGR